MTNPTTKNSSSPLKIAIDVRTAHGNKAGKGWYTLNLVNSLLKIDSQNHYILYTQSYIQEFASFRNATQVVIPTKGLRWHFKVSHNAKKQKVDYFISPTSYIIPSIITSKIKTITTVHDLISILFPDNHEKKAVFIEKLLLNRTLRRSHHIIPVSHSTLQDLKNQYKKAPISATVIPNAASNDYRPLTGTPLHEFKEAHNINSPFFLAVGTIIPRKNYSTLIDAFREFQKSHPDHKLIIVGQDGWGAQEIHLKVKEHGLENNIIFWGYCSNEELVYLYNLAVALICPSLYEGFGIPPLEAMQSGCPVIASNRSSLPEVVGDSAIMIDPNSSKRITQAMEEILNPDTRQKLISSGLNRSKEFSWEKSAAKLLKILK
ncbi:glycosyltransferase family 1 protein [Candidatus Peregrinibacteria bacterium HGW-Peregrinibacteria-1]|jgi:glycosyltransferase involved in cell wall biosynthesis|nr:MAG: glycosyltransferase family 1 protein [Candidatus Peregrinibacteria bacterium HGW-Peregrinibacteria-1]